MSPVMHAVSCTGILVALVCYSVAQVSLEHPENIAYLGFGASVAVSAPVVVVGVPNANGTIGEAYVYWCPTPTSCSNRTRLVPIDADRTSLRNFGRNVAMSGSTVVVGLSGAAYVFSCPAAGGCQLGSRIAAPDGGSTFGSTVALSGSVVAVAASSNTANAAQGAVYLFSCPTASTCGAGSRIVAPDGDQGDGFGCSLSISGTTVVVGAANKDINDNDKQGAAYAFSCPTTSTCDTGSRLVAPDSSRLDYFGTSVAIDGSVVVIGAPFKSSTFSPQGAAYLFSCPTATTCDAGTRIDNDRGMLFGSAVAVTGSLVLIGASLTTYLAPGSITPAYAGTAYLFNCPTTSTCSQGAEIVGPDSADNDGFGSVVAMDASLVAIGAPSKTVNGLDFQGAAYVTQPCPPGSIFEGPGKPCRLCARGDYSRAPYIPCSVCPVGSVSTHRGTIQCDQCGPGFVSIAPDKHCSGCPPGTFSPNSTTPCTECPRGSYAIGFGNSYCFVCGPGRYWTAIDEQCFRCKAGTYSSDIFTPCAPCPPYSATPYPGSTACELCGPGKPFVQPWRSCAQCAPGTFSPNATTPCAACPPFTVAPFYGMSECTQCRPGYPFTSPTKRCIRCQPGTFSPDATTPCAACPPYTVAPFYGMTECRSCGPGHPYISATEQCKACPAGTASPDARTPCAPCPPGTVAPFHRSVACKPCENNRVALRPDQACTRCPAGTRPNEQHTACIE